MGSRRKRRRRNAAVRALLYVVVCACVIGIGYSGYRIYAIQSEYAKGQNLYADIRREMTAQAAVTAAPEVSAGDAGGAARPSAQAEGGALSAPGDAQGRVRDVVFDARPASAMDFNKLTQMNADAVAWISQSGSVIDYPVVQGDDNEYYLNHLFTGGYGIAGTVFMEVTNAADFTDKNTILFGHHMNDGSMFASLDKYRKQQYYDEHPAMTLYTPAGDHVVEWFAGYVITPDPLPIRFESDEAFIEYVDEARRKSNFRADVEVLPTDRILTLCTCTYVSDDARYILVGVVR